LINVKANRTPKWLTNRSQSQKKKKNCQFFCFNLKHQNEYSSAAVNNNEFVGNSAPEESIDATHYHVAQTRTCLRFQTCS